jgi:hypothetical protein
MAVPLSSLVIWLSLAVAINYQIHPEIARIFQHVMPHLDKVRFEIGSTSSLQVGFVWVCFSRG